MVPLEILGWEGRSLPTWILDMENLGILVVSMVVVGSDVGPQGPR